ncbi:MAG: ABC transporter substrate-binding protein [Ignavibacteria bacterium]|nr:ABC transporter substrate-binding protein [Ignavibacteria bacterium]
MYSKLIPFLCVVLLLSCGGKKEQAIQSSGAGGTSYGGEYRTNEAGELRSLDPVGINDATSHHIAEQIYDNLVTFDEKLHIKSELAESWEVSPDGITYTYHLRKGVKFHDNPCFPNGKGRELTAEDVKYSYTRICDMRTNTRGFGYFQDKVLGASEYFESTRSAIQSQSEPTIKDIPGFIVVDKYTFQVKLTRAFAPFENYPALGVAMIHPREAVEYYKKDFFQHPVGTGPFVFTSWTPDRECLMSRNPSYWEKDEHGNQLPFLDKIKFTFVKDLKAQLLEFKQGNLDEAYRIPSEFFADIVGEKNAPKGEYAKYQLLSLPAMSTQFYGMLFTSKEFSDKRVRQAFSLAVDRERIIKYVLKGQAAAPGFHGIIPPSMPDYACTSIEGYKFDLERARKLLTEAGYPNGKGFPTVTFQLNSGGGRNLQVAEAVQSMLTENLGVKVELKEVEWAKHLDEVDAGHSMFFRLGWVADYPDPENFLNLCYGKIVPPEGAASPINQVRYVNPAFDKLFDEAVATIDRTKRLDLYRQAEQIAMTDAPMLILFYDADYRLLQPNIEGYHNNPMDRRYYKHIWINPAKPAAKR